MAEILSIGELLDLGGSASTAGLIPYSALEYSAQKITAISGTAIGGQGGTDSATVSAIASAYAESAVSSKVDQSAFDQCCSSMSGIVSALETGVTSMSSVVSGLTGDYLEKSASSMFQPSGDYAFNSSFSSYIPVSASAQFAPSGDYAFNSAMSGKLDASASSQFQPSGDYAFNSALSSKLDKSAFTAYTATATQGHTYQGVDPIVVDNTADTISLSATAVLLDGTMTSYVSGGTGFIGVNGNITSQMTSFVKTADMSGYIPTSESAGYYPTSNPSSFATTADLSGKLDVSAQAVSAIGTTASAVGAPTLARYINGDAIWAETSTMASVALKYWYESTVPGYSATSDHISALRNSAQDLYSAKLDASANLVTALSTATVSGSAFVSKINGMDPYYARYAYSAGNVNHAEGADVATSAYANGEYVTITGFVLSAVSSKLDSSASSDFMAASASGDYYPMTGNPSSFLTASYEPTFGYDDGKISSIDGSALAGADGLAYTSPSATIAIDNVNGTLENTNSALRVTEHITAAQHLTGFSASGGSDINLNAEFYVNGEGYELTFPGISAETGIYTPPASLYISASASTDSWWEPYYDAQMDISAISSVSVPLTGNRLFKVYLSMHPYYGTAGSASGSVDIPGATASSTGVSEMAWADMVPPMSAWQSLTAWAVAQGWTP